MFHIGSVFAVKRTAPAKETERLFLIGKDGIGKPRTTGDPLEEPLRFKYEDHLEALVAGWPWTHATSLFLPEDERVFWVRRGSAGADLSGVSSTGQPVAVELKRNIWERPEKAIRQVVRGLVRFWSGKESFRAPFQPLRLASPYAVLAFDGTHTDQFRDRLDEFVAVVNDVLSRPSNETSGSKESEALDLFHVGPRQAQFVAAAISRHNSPDGLIIKSTLWDFGLLPRA